MYLREHGHDPYPVSRNQVEPRLLKMVDLLDQFESVGLRQDGARRRPQQPVNPFDEPEVASLPAVS